ncbi:MAG: ferric reductase [Actinobacteria bacterium]|nr:ferric reductase [Actinomycetota bacterium]
MLLWYTARGAGLSALILLTATTALGAITSGRGRPTGRLVTQYVHRVLGGLGLGVLVLHVVTILADSYAHVGVTGAIVPFTAGYRATWVGLGTIAAYLLLFVSVLGLGRGRLAGTRRGAAIWRSLHALAYGAWGFAIIHGFESGTDSGVLWVRALYVLCLVAVAGSLSYRFTAPVRRADVLAAAPAHAARFGAAPPVHHHSSASAVAR